MYVLFSKKYIFCIICNVNEQKRKKIKSKFNIAYWVVLAVIILCRILDKTSPTKEVSDIFFYIAFSSIIIELILMFICAFICYSSTKIRIISIFCFLGNALTLFLIPFISSDIVIIINFVYNTILGVYVLIDYTLYKTKFPTGTIYNKDFLFVLGFALLLPLVRAIKHKYLQDEAPFLYGLIVTGVLLVVFTILSFTIFKETYKKFAKGVWKKICVAILALFIFTSYGMAFIDIANTSLASASKQIECVILDKRVTSGYRQITDYKLYIELENKKVWISVSSDTYSSKSINDTLLLNYYNGNLNLPYYESAE